MLYLITSKTVFSRAATCQSERMEKQETEVFSDAIRERASALVVAHNHPSDILKPSQKDMLE